MKNVKTLLILLSISTLMFASQQRVSALGGNAAYWHEDDANIWVFPHTVNKYNIANTDGSDFYVSWGDGSKFGFAGGTASDMLKLTWGNGSNMGANFGLNMTPEVAAVAASCDDGASGDADACDTAGGTWDAGSMKTDAVNVISVGFGMNMAFGDVGVTFDNDAGTNLGLVLRAQQGVWIWDNTLVNFGINSPEEGDAVMDLGVNLYTHLEIAENTLGLWATGFGWTNDATLNDGDGNITFPAMTFAVESAMQDWIDVRAGFTKDWSITSTSSTGVTPTFGLGFNYGSFNLDVDVGASLFTNPVQTITGYSALGATGFNLTYNW